MLGFADPNPACASSAPVSAGCPLIHVRPYRSQDCAATAALFHDTVHAVNARDYTQEQLDAWAPAGRDLAAWSRSLREHHALVAVLVDGTPTPGAFDAAPGFVAPAVAVAAHVGGTVVGFGDVDTTMGYLDRLYVHKDYQGQGIAGALCDTLEQAVLDVRPIAFGPVVIETHASITARPFFERRGYHVVRRQRVERRGVILENYRMQKVLRSGD